MVTRYKPSQRRGKRVTYRSTDPDEPRRETLKLIKFATLGIFCLGILWLVLVLSR